MTTLIMNINDVNTDEDRFPRQNDFYWFTGVREPEHTHTHSHTTVH